MTHHEDDTTIARVMETLISNGMEGLGEAFGILYNAAMGGRWDAIDLEEERGRGDAIDFIDK